MTHPAQLGDKDLIDTACAVLGISLDELGVKLKFKSIRRYRNGEYPLTQTKRQHLHDLLAIQKVGGPALQSLSPGQRSAPSNMPPHRELDPDRSKQDPSMYKGGSSDLDFAGCVKILSELHDRHPQVFQSAAAMIKGLWESLKK